MENNHFVYVCVVMNKSFELCRLGQVILLCSVAQFYVC